MESPWKSTYTLVVCYALLGVLVLLSHTQLIVSASKVHHQKLDLLAVKDLKPLKENDPNVFFWRPQKVGSSTLLSILMSYAYRYNHLPRRKSGNNSYCRRFAKCALIEKHYSNNDTMQRLLKYVAAKTPGTTNSRQNARTLDLESERIADTTPHKISLTHEMCNLDSEIINATMQCSFQSVPGSYSNIAPVKELFMVREPLSRAVSVYYFWGELYKLHHIAKTKARGANNQNNRMLADKSQGGRQAQAKLGQNTRDITFPIVGADFEYHGDETTAPPLAIAKKFANRPNGPYRAGMPGPSFTWSAFADNVEDAVEIVLSDRICTVVLERLHESLVVVAHYLGWSLADVVTTKYRKALSKHPKYSEWPKPAIAALKSKLSSPSNGEYAIYNASVTKLDQRIQALSSVGIDVQKEVGILKALQARASQICLNDTYMVVYRDMIKQQKLPQHWSQNKLRDVEEKYVEDGHMFSFNREILMSFDVCGPCEAHAMLLSIQNGLATSVTDAIPLSALDKKYVEGNVNFAKCPKFYS